MEIGFLEGLRARMPDDTETLKLLGDDYTRAGRWKEGLDVDRELAQLLPKDSMVQYNLACSMSLLGRVRESAEAVHRAIELGYNHWDWLMKDPDLVNLRKGEEFKAIFALMPDRTAKKST